MPTDTASRKTPRQAFRYVASFLAAMAAFFLCGLLLLPTRWFAARSGDPYLAGLGYGASLHNADCDIVLDGDSSAEVGLEPTVFEQQIHLKTCNIAEPDGVRVVNGSSVLDQYLAQNAPPRIILFLFNAPNLNPSAYPGELGLFEGFTYRMRQPHAAVFAMHHPALTLKWIRTGLPLATHSLVHPQTSPTRASTGGRLVLRGEPRRTCAALSMPAAPDKAWLNSLRTRYSSARTSVLINVMPLADCDTRFILLRQQLHGAVNNELTTLPASDFLERGPHMTDVGVMRLSEQIAAQIPAANLRP